MAKKSVRRSQLSRDAPYRPQGRHGEPGPTDVPQEAVVRVTRSSRRLRGLPPAEQALPPERHRSGRRNQEASASEAAPTGSTRSPTPMYDPPSPGVPPPPPMQQPRVETQAQEAADAEQQGAPGQEEQETIEQVPQESTAQEQQGSLSEAVNEQLSPAARTPAYRESQEAMGQEHQRSAPEDMDRLLSLSPTADSPIAPPRRSERIEGGPLSLSQKVQPSVGTDAGEGSSSDPFGKQRQVPQVFPTQFQEEHNELEEENSEEEKERQRARMIASERLGYRQEIQEQRMKVSGLRIQVAAARQEETAEIKKDEAEEMELRTMQEHLEAEERVLQFWTQHRSSNVEFVGEGLATDEENLARFRQDQEQEWQQRSEDAQTEQRRYTNIFEVETSMLQDRIEAQLRELNYHRALVGEARQIRERLLRDIMQEQALIRTRPTKKNKTKRRSSY
ncbi:hypothetical protein BCR43DRAFT_549816 [Syncephalastrum racemosum]|uniref:Uncharacterized protein n=1 Tax=Syncephalastrum racemosum TaxID=13706 RepID=A0A1X2HB27_SYNRA|nr:hypothetical protein BCR43DRAFT_549816 [Syncephalastrum racemosum]